MITWRLETLSEGHIILMGHSLGGFLTADAAVGGKVLATLRRRIIGMIAFDVPYLGSDTGSFGNYWLMYDLIQAYIPT